jgi:hypothetical protein
MQDILSTMEIILQDSTAVADEAKFYSLDLKKKKLLPDELDCAGCNSCTQ